MEKWRQRFHIEPPDGWLNDPNGLSFFNDRYHIYFQYSPKSPEGKTKRCWGHYMGENLIDVTYDDIVLSPSCHEDKDGVYSGSAVEHEGILHIFYTGNVKEEGDYDYIRSGRGANVIHVTTKDGHTMSKKQILLQNSDYPDFCSCHVRDPKVWYDGEKWKMVLGARTMDDKGCVLIYHSNDLEKWEYDTVISIPDFGYMWECPDYFELEGKGYLSVSPQGLPHYDTKYQNIFQSGYFDVQGRLEENHLGKFTEWDMGFDFYAPQTFEAPDGRRILIGWMGMDNKSYDNATIPLGWQHCLTLPRELTVGKDGRLLQNPVKELVSKRKEQEKIKNGENRTVSLPFELCGFPEKSFKISFDEKAVLKYDSEDELVSFTFNDDTFGSGRTVRRAQLLKCSNVRIIADMSSLEIYMDGGSIVMSARFYPANEKIALFVNGFDGTLWSME